MEVKVSYNISLKMYKNSNGGGETRPFNYGVFFYFVSEKYV